MDRTQGNERMTQTKAISGADERPVTDASREFGPEVEQRPGTLIEVSYAASRTVSLGDFEFVRIQIGARAGFTTPSHLSRDDAFDRVKAFVLEILAREEALVRRKQRPAEPLPKLEGAQRVVWVEYGMTLKAAAKYESHKIDLGLSRPLGDDEDEGAAVDALQTYLAQRVAQERDRVRGKE